MNVATANKLVQLRKEKGFSQEELAEKLGISRQAISKWERAEASPDTDNLVTLAKLYGISLDELLGNELEQSEEEREYSQAAGDRKSGVDFTNGINVNDGGEYVHVGWDGIHVHDKGGEEVHIADGKVNVNGEEYDIKRRWYTFPVPFIITIAYIIMGVAFNMWHPWWLLFMLVPVFYSLIKAIEKRNFHDFAYPILITVIYLWFGFTAGAWHPNWVLFLTVPLYYMIFPSRKHEKNDESFCGDNGGCDGCNGCDR